MMISFYNPRFVVRIQVRVRNVWVGVVWACILIFVWLRGKIHVGEWCCEVVRCCEVQQVVRCSFLLSHNLIKTCLCVCVCVRACVVVCMTSWLVVRRSVHMTTREASVN